MIPTTDFPRRSAPLLAGAALALAACAGLSPPTAPGPHPPAAPAQPAPESQAQIDSRRQSDFDKSLDAWHGARIKELTAKLGPPTSTIRQPGAPLVYVYAKTGKLSGPTGPVSFSCVVRYTIDERADRVIGHRIEGC
ncbi:MAG: hypothetical protein ABW005_06725 [Burkholderiaceae bacterium]